MVKVEVYSGTPCPYCDRAKALLARKGVAYTEYDVRKDSERLKEMGERAKGARTIPQIFINDKLIGGFDALNALENNNELNALLGL